MKAATHGGVPFLSIVTFVAFPGNPVNNAGFAKKLSWVAKQGLVLWNAFWW